MKYRLNVVSVLIGYRSLEKIMSLFRLYMFCANYEHFCQKYRIMWPMSSYFFWNLAILFSNSSLGGEKLKQNRHSLMKSRLTDLNNFIRKRVTAKSNDFTSLLFNRQHSKPYKVGKHFALSIFRGIRAAAH